MTRVGFLLFYLLGMLPTYILPYFGSNSTVLQGVSALATHSNFGLTWTVLHLGALASLVYVAYARSVTTGKMMVVALPVVAAVFDMTPILSAIPLVPTILHVVALVLGFGGDDVESSDKPVPFLVRQPLFGLLGIYGISAVLAAGLAMTGVLQTKDTVAKAESEASSTFKPGRIKTLEELKARDGVSPPAKALAAPPASAQSSRDKDYGFGKLSDVRCIGNAPCPSNMQPATTGGVATGSPEAPTPLPPTGRAVPPPPAPSPDAVAEQTRQAQAERAKEDALRAAINEKNAYLASAQASDMAHKYVERYVDFIRAGDAIGAAAVFKADRTKGDRLVGDIRDLGGVSRVEYDSVSLVRSTNPRMPDGLRVTANIYPPLSRAFTPIRKTFLLTLHDDFKFITLTE